MYLKIINRYNSTPAAIIGLTRYESPIDSYYRLYKYQLSEMIIELILFYCILLYVYRLYILVHIQ